MKPTGMLRTFKITMVNIKDIRTGHGFSFELEAHNKAEAWALAPEAIRKAVKQNLKYLDFYGIGIEDPLDEIHPGGV